MTALLIILLLAAIIFGIGAVLEGVFWLLLIALVVFVAVAVFGWTKLRGLGRSRTSNA